MPMIDDKFNSACSNATMKIIDNGWRYGREELQQTVQDIMKHIILGAEAKARLELKGTAD